MPAELIIAGYTLFHTACGLAAIRMARRTEPELFLNSGGVLPAILLIGGPVQLAFGLLVPRHD